MKHILIRTNAAYLIIGIIGYIFIGYYALPLIIGSVCSALYYNNERSIILLNCDQICAWLVMLTNVYLVFNAPNAITLIGTILAFMSIYRYKKKHNREYNHSIWHIISAIATGIIYYGYYLSL